MNKVGQVQAGLCKNVNTLNSWVTTYLNRSSDSINQIIDSLDKGVKSGEDTRWEWILNGEFTTSNPISCLGDGISGTSIFSYVGSDYKTIDPIFISINDNNEARPNTLFETFLSLKDYVNVSISENSERLRSIVASIENPYDLTGLPNGSLLCVESGEVSSCGIVRSTETIDTVLYYTYLFGNYGLKYGTDGNVKINTDTFDVTWNKSNSAFSLNQNITIDPGDEGNFTISLDGTSYISTDWEEGRLILEAPSRLSIVTNRLQENYTDKETTGVTLTEVYTIRTETYESKIENNTEAQHCMPAPNHPIQSIEAIKQYINNGVKHVILRPGAASDEVYLPVRRNNEFDDGRELIIKSIAGDDITIICAGDENIDGDPTALIADKESRLMVFESATKTWHTMLRQ